MDKTQANISLSNKCTSTKNQGKRSNFNFSNFYILLLIQISVIFFSPNILEDQFFFDIKVTNYYSKITFDDYCQLTHRCGNSKDENFYREDYENYKNWLDEHNLQQNDYNDLAYYSLIIYPTIVVFQSFLRNFSFLVLILYNRQRKLQVVLYVIQLIAQGLFVKVISILVEKSLSPQIYEFLQNFFAFLFLNILGLLVNQRITKFKLNTSNTAVSIMIFYLIATTLQLLTNYFEISNLRWASQMSVMFITQFYLLHLNTYLFDSNNKYIKHNKSLILVIWDKINPIVQMSDEMKQMQTNIFVLQKSKAIFFCLMVLASIYFKEFILQPYVLSGLGLCISILIWDTSLISTKSPMTHQDSYLAANLFFLDMILPFRNLVSDLIV